jgi:hypothetical protein
MRSSVFVAFLVTSAALLAGCSGNGDDDHREHTYTCPNGTTIDLTKFPDHDNATFNPASKCPRGTTTATNTTSLPPNRLPDLVLKITDGSNETQVTMLGGNLTFDASGSSDPDGQITGIAVTVQDSNNTRTATLYDAGRKQFQPATFRFDRPGVVNVTVAMVDDRAGFTINQTNVYVDHLQTPTPATIALPDPGAMEACGGTDDLVEAPFYKEFGFTLSPGATWIEASATPETAILTICAPKAEGADTSTAISESGNPVVSNEGVALPPAPGITSYYIGATIAPGEPQQEVAVTVIVHYGPRPAAA